MINGKTKVYAVIGCPVEHSVSPIIHNTLFEYYGMNNVYIPLNIKPENIKTAFDGMKSIGLGGFNATIPHKKDIFSLVDNVDDYAKIVGVVNTVNIIHGKTYGYNTDGIGFVKSLEEIDCTVENKKILILGGGGVVNSVATKLAFENASEIVVVTRRKEQADSVCNLVNSVKNIAKSDLIENYSSYLNFDIIINATPVGMYPNIDNCPVENLNLINKNSVVCDLIYNPIKTRFLKLAESMGCRTLNGLGMLIYQGFAAFEIWTGIKPDSDITQTVKSKTREALGLE